MSNFHIIAILIIHVCFLNNREENRRLKELLDIRRGNDVARLPLSGHPKPVSLPEATEYEYLRNILFEYMMGREPVVSNLVNLKGVMEFNFDLSLADPSQSYRRSGSIFRRPNGSSSEATRNCVKQSHCKASNCIHGSMIIIVLFLF